VKPTVSRNFSYIFGTYLCIYLSIYLPRVPRCQEPKEEEEEEEEDGSSGVQEFRRQTGCQPANRERRTPNGER
jgi:hypothetical protein